MEKKVFLLCILPMSAESYQVNKCKNYVHHKLETDCLTNKSKLKTNLNDDVHVFSFNSSSFPHNTLDCHLELVVPSSNFGFSVFIEQMSLSGSLSGCREDFLQFSRDILFVTTHASRKYCGIVELPLPKTVDGKTSLIFPQTPISSRVYSEEEDQDLDVWLHVENIFSDRSVFKTFTILVTPFQKTCGDQDGLYRKCLHSNACIKKEMFCDGRVNCPDLHGATGDEAKCLANLLEKEDPLLWTGLTVIFIFTGLLICVAICSVLVYKRLTKPTAKVPQCQVQRRQLEELLAADFPPQILPTCPPPHPPPYSNELLPSELYPSEPPRYELLWN